MPQQGDIFAMLLVIAAAALWGWLRFNKWLHAPSRVKLPFPEAAPVARTEAVRLLEEAGYEVVCGKMKVPLIVEVDDETMASRMFVDYFARKDRELYVVKVSRRRQPVEWTASGVRDRFLPYGQLFEETHGVLYVDTEEGKVHRIAFDIGEAEPTPGREIS